MDAVESMNTNSQKNTFGSTTSFELDQSILAQQLPTKFSEESKDTQLPTKLSEKVEEEQNKV